MFIIKCRQNILDMQCFRVIYREISHQFTTILTRPILSSSIDLLAGKFFSPWGNAGIFSWNTTRCIPQNINIVIFLILFSECWWCKEKGHKRWQCTKFRGFCIVIIGSLYTRSQVNLGIFQAVIVFCICIVSFKEKIHLCVKCS